MNDRRSFLAIAAAGLAGVVLAPGVRLIEIAQAAPGTKPTGANPQVRWGMLVGADAESGADAGSSWGVRAYDDAGAEIDTPIVIVRKAGEAITVALGSPW